MWIVIRLWSTGHAKRFVVGKFEDLHFGDLITLQRFFLLTHCKVPLHHDVVSPIEHLAVWKGKAHTGF